MEKFFHLKERGTNVRTEIVAGVTTFMAMAYILMVNANMFADPYGIGGVEGQLLGVSSIISQCGGNVVSVHHERSDANMAVASCFLKIGMETRDFKQIEEIRAALTAAGFKIVS